jgi:hypothetical protein
MRPRQSHFKPQCRAFSPINLTYAHRRRFASLSIRIIDRSTYTALVKRYGRI